MTTLMVTTDLDAALPTIVVDGLLDGSAEGPLLDALAGVPTPVPRVRLDLARMSYMNSSGIASVVMLLKQARGDGVAITVAGLTPHYRHLLEITRIADLVDIEEATQ